MAKLALWFWRGVIALCALVTLGVVVGRLLNPFFNDIWYLAGVPLAIAAGRFKRDQRGALAALAVATVWGLTTIRLTGPVRTKTVVMGVDGATFEVIDARSHLLPNFIQLRADGSRGVLHSMEPMFSPLLWTTIASGRPPDEHGIKGFRVHSNNCQVARLWDIAEDKGMGVGLYKWLVDYPPRKFKHGGFWVPSWLAPDIQTWPEELSVVKELELAKRLRRKQVEAQHSNVELAWLLVGAGMRLSTLLDAAEWSWEEKALKPSALGANVRMQLLRGKIDRDVFIRQLHKTQPEFATFNYYATDGLAHLYWDRYLKGETQVTRAYQQADQILGEIRANLGPDATLFLVSDHGFKEMDATGQAGQFAPLTERLRVRLIEQVGEVDVSKVGHKLTVGFKDEEQLARGRAWLETVLDAKGAPFYRFGEVPDVRTALALTLADESITKERLANDTVGGEPIGQYVKLTDEFTGTHKENGVFYAVGPGIPAYKELEGLRLIDVAPTVLASMGIPASVEMRGKTLLYPELPKVDDWDHLLADLDWIGLEETAAGDVNTEALKALGYIDDVAPSAPATPSPAAPASAPPGSPGPAPAP